MSTEPGSEASSRSSHRARTRERHLNSTAELVQAGGNRGALGILVYLVVGTAFWTLVGSLADNLVGTHWLVYAGAAVGLAGGLCLTYLRLQSGLRTSDDSQDDDDAARNRRSASQTQPPQGTGRDGSRKDRP